MSEKPDEERPGWPWVDVLSELLGVSRWSWQPKSTAGKVVQWTLRIVLLALLVGFVLLLLGSTFDWF